MAEKIFYEKVGRKYVPISLYNSEWVDSFHKGTHLVVSKPGSTSRMFNVDPAFAPMIAAGSFALDSIADAIVNASNLRLPSSARKTPMTKEQQDAWENLVKAFGPEVRQLEWPSARESAEAGVKAMQQEADKLLSNPAVKKAWDYFMTVCELTKDSNGQSNP